MTNKEQIWQERLAIIKDALSAMAPGLVVFVIFIGVVVATGRINAQWQEGVRARKANVNSLAVDQLKDFAVIQAGTNELDALPEGIDANRFVSDNQAFVDFVAEYFNWNGFDQLSEKREEAVERIGAYDSFWTEAFFILKWDSSSDSWKVRHDAFFGNKQERSVITRDENGRRYRYMWQIASVEDIHAIEIMPDGSYMYLAVVPAYRYYERPEGEPFSRRMCMGVWYQCDENSVITPVRIGWLTMENEPAA